MAPNSPIAPDQAGAATLLKPNTGWAFGKCRHENIEEVEDQAIGLHAKEK